MLASVAWVAIVIAGSAVTWVAIDHAGQQVTGSPDVSETQPAVVGTVGAPPTGRVSPSRHPSASSSVSAPVATSGPSVGSTVPTHAASPGPGSATQKTSSPRPAPTTQTRTWTGTGGWVTVSCTGGRATFKGASPNNGWSFERGDTSGEEVEVKFSNGENEVQVKATCVDGVPRFEVESGRADDH